jgi:hypothetical protein
MLSTDELNKILETIDKQFLLFIGTTVGERGLTDTERAALTAANIDYTSLYDESKDLVKLNFQLGMLSNILSQSQMESFDYDSLNKYIRAGNYIPLNEREERVLESIRNQSLADIRDTRGRIFRDITGVVNQGGLSERANQEEFIREKIREGVEARKSRKEIARDIARLTGDWSRNFTKSVSYISHTAFNEGRANIIANRYGGNSKAYVWFQVQLTACPSCIKAYLKGAAGSEPIVFLLSDILANGTNIGKKQADWLPVIGAMHPHCRCAVQEYIPGSTWDGKRFVLGKVPGGTSQPERPKIRVIIDGKEAWV